MSDNQNQPGFTPPKGWENSLWQPGNEVSQIDQNAARKAWETETREITYLTAPYWDEETRTVDGKALRRIAGIPEPEDNWHAESDRFAFWLIMSIPLGFLFAALLVLGIYAVAAP